jgi:hypothetical protein
MICLLPNAPDVRCEAKSLLLLLAWTVVCLARLSPSDVNLCLRPACVLPPFDAWQLAGFEDGHLHPKPCGWLRGSGLVKPQEGSCGSCRRCYLAVPELLLL